MKGRDIVEEIMEFFRDKKYLRARIEFSKNLPVTIQDANSKPIKIDLHDLVHSEDLPAISDQIHNLSSNAGGEIFSHFRLKSTQNTDWYLLVCDYRKELMKSPYLQGHILNVSEYIETAMEDPILRSFRNKAAQSILTASASNLKLIDIVDKTFLEKIQLPFKLGNGIYSAIFDADEKLICTPNPKDSFFDVSRFNFSVKKRVRANHATIAYWAIAAQKEESIEKNTPLLEIMVQTLSRIANSFVLLYNEVVHSERSNKMLSENVEQQILTIGIYNELLETNDTKEAINNVLKIIGEYIGVDRISLFLRNDKREQFDLEFCWMLDGKEHCEADYLKYDVIPNVINQLEFTDYYHPSGFTHELSDYGIKHFIAANINGEGGRIGLMLSSVYKGERLPTEQESRVIRSAARIVSSAVMRYKTDLKLAETVEEVKYLAFNDSVLDIPNRAKLDQDVNTELETKCEGALVFIKVTNLRTFNELFGHAYTDQLVKAVASYIHEIDVESNCVYRFSGNIIAILLRGADAFSAKRFSETLLHRFKMQWRNGENEHYLEAGVGIAQYPHNGTTNDELYRCASLAMYKAIEYGINSYAFYSKEFEKPASFDYIYAEKLRESIKNSMNGFFLRFQPTINLQTGEMGPCEVLIGWKDGDDSLPTSKLISIAENIGFDIAIDRWMIHQACLFCKKMQELYSADFSVSVNITGRELQSGSIVSMVNSALEKSGLDGGSLFLEITSRVAVKSNYNLLPAITKLKKSGVKIVIDNYGSELLPSTLLKYSYIDMLKADFSLFSNVFDDIDEIMLDTSLRLAKTIPDGLCVKRIESREQLEDLSRFGVNYVQGHYFAQPMYEDELIGFMQERRVGTNANSHK